MPQPPSSPANAPTDYQSPAVKRLAERCIDAVRSDGARLDRDKTDWANLLGYRGGVENWWIVFDRDQHVWRTLPTDDSELGLPEDVPRQASNVFKRKIDGIASILNQSDPAQEWGPAKDDDEARATADVCEEALPVLRQECGFDQTRDLINLHVCLTDKVGFEIYFDADEKYGTEMIQALECPSCGWQGMPMEVGDAGDTCPQCGTPGEKLEPMVSPTFEPIGVHYPKGKVCGRLIPSFELSLPPNARECHEQKVPYLVTHTNMPRTDAMRMWKDKAEFIKNAKTESSAGHNSASYATAMRNISSPHAAARGVNSQTQDTVLVWRVVHDPITDADEQVSLPEGLDITLIDGEIIEAGPLELKDDQGQPMKPIFLRTYIQAPGSPFGIPPADDLAVLQRQRNLIETLLVAVLENYASPTTWIPTTLQLEDDIKRTPGAINRYRSNVPGERPITEQGTGPSEGLFKFLEMNDAAFDTISGLNAVLEGQRPEGDPTKGEVEILRERGMATFKAPLSQLVDFEKRVSYGLLQLSRQSLWTPRLIRTMGDNGEWSVKAFTHADLHGSVDVFVNPASAWPKSQLLQQLRLEKAIELGAINPQDPEIQEQILSDFDLTHFKPSLDADKKQIAREIDRWKAAHTAEEIAPPAPYINAPMHLHYKSQFMKTEEAEMIRELNPAVWQGMNAHITQLQLMVTPPAPAPGPGGKPGQPQAPDGSAVEQLVSSGAITPVDQSTPASPLDAMIARGDVQPVPAMPPGQAGPSVDDLTAQAANRVM